MKLLERENHLKRKEALVRKGWRFFLVLVLGISIIYLPSFSFGGEVDILIEKLVEKGLLTKSDAEGILKEIKQETAKQEKEKMKEAELPQWTKKLPNWIINPPEWIKNIKFSGDLRLRYQWEERKDDDKEDRHRGRFRLRLGAETKLMDQVKVGFGLATGSGDPRSTNLTFENSSEKKGVRIDYAFAQYTPAKWFSLIGGKIHNPLFRPSDLLWDSDITPEGVAAKVQYPILPKLEAFFNTGFFILDERSSAKDPYMVVLQPGLNWKMMDDINLKLAFAYYFFGGVRGNTLENGSNSNTLVGGKLRYKYNAPVVSAEFGYKNPFGLTFIPYFGVFGEYVYNPAPSVVLQ